MPAFDCLGDPVRRRILGLRRDDGQAVDEVAAVVELTELRISQPGVPANPRWRSATTDL